MQAQSNILRIGNREIVTDDVYEIVIDNFPDIVHSVDADGNIVFTNKKAEALLGYTRAELIGMNIRQIYADEVLEALAKGFKNLKQAGEKTVESVLKDRFGNRIPVEIRSFSIYDRGGKFLRTFSILRDIRQIKELQDGLIHTERMAAIGELATGIVHDINNPLAVITMSAQLVQEEAGAAGHEDLRSLAGNITKAASAIERLAKHLREFSRRVKEEPQRLNLNTVLEESLFLLQSKLNKNGIVVDRRLGEPEHAVRGEPNHLEQVFANLVSNACDAMAGRTERRLTLSIAAVDEDKVPYWRCDVADTGCGIPPDIQKDIFNPFFTTKERGKGTGLGLSIARGIIREHRGEIRVVSEAGRGTVFSVLLPQDALPA